MKEEGVFEEAQAEAVKEVIAWQLGEAMKERKRWLNPNADLQPAELWADRDLGLRPRLG